MCCPSPLPRVITTTHSEIGYAHNVAIVAEALRSNFLLSEDTHVLTAVAGHIWSEISERDVKQWGLPEVQRAMARVLCTKCGYALGWFSCACEMPRATGALASKLTKA